MYSIRAYAAEKETRILSTFAAHDVLAASFGCKQGPHTLTYALRLVHNIKPQLDRALQLGPVIEGAVMDTPVRIRHRNGFIYVEIPSPVPVPVHAPNLRGEGLAVPVGMTTVRNVRGIDFGNPSTAHLVIVAGTGRGKTTAARTILYGLARQNAPGDVRLAVCTFKPLDWGAFGSLPHTVEIATEPRQIVRILRWARAEVYRRAQAGAMSPRYVIVLDDMYNWGKVVDVGPEIGEIASLGRAAGVHLVISTQKVTTEGVGNNAAAIANISTRLVLGATSAPEAAQVTGLRGTGAEMLGKHPGDALLIAAGSPVRIACASVDDGAVRALAAGRADREQEAAPWADLEPAMPQGTSTALTVLTVNGAEGASLDTVSSDTPPVGPLTLPLQRIDPPTPEQVQVIARVFQQTGGSLNKTVEQCYGPKGAKTLRLVHTALQQAGLREGGDA